MESATMEKIFSILDTLVAENPSEPPGSQPNIMADYQAKALINYQQLPVPSARLKSWSKLATITMDEVSLELASPPKISTTVWNDSEAGTCARIVLAENTLEFQISAAAAKQGVVLCGLDEASKQHGKILEQALKRVEDKNDDKVAAFTASKNRHGFLLYVPDKAQLEKPIEILIQSGAKNIVLPMSAWIVLGDRAEAAVVMRQRTTPEDQDLSVISMNMIVALKAEAKLQFLEIQKYGQAVWNFVNELSILGKDAQLERFLLDAGGAVTKRILSVILQEEGSQATITGIYTPRDNQVFVYDTHQNHTASRTTSDLLFNGVLDNHSYSLWKGNVYVAAGTKGADGFQINRNLLLDEAVQAESIPGLEILADDVRCSHAVTLSSVDAEQMFFLQSRGIDPAEAEELIVSGFLEAASTRIEAQNLREIIQEALK